MRSQFFVAALTIVCFCVSRLVAAAADEPEPEPASSLRTTILKLIDSVSDLPPSEAWQSTIRPGESIYSVTVEFDRSSWADIWSKPDLFVAIECEGRQTVVIPQIEYDWDYSRKILNVRCPTLPAYSRCVLRLYDDDSVSDALWRNLLATRVDWTLGAAAESSSLPVAGVQSVQAKFAASGELQLLDPATKDWISLDAPDSLASAEFIVPPVPAGTAWTMEGPFVHGDRVVGSVSFKHHATRPLAWTWSWATVVAGLVLLAALVALVWWKSQYAASATATSEPENWQRGGDFSQRTFSTKLG